MRTSFEKTVCAALLAFWMCLSGSPCLASDLIAPTRTLQGRGEAVAKLTVFSEPPKLEVSLDGKRVGKTPLWLSEVKTGWHTLTIKGKSARVYLGSRKVLEVGLFRGDFIILPGKKKERVKPLRVEQPQAPAPPAAAPPSEAQRKEQLTRWELFVNGSLRHF